LISGSRPSFGDDNVIEEGIDDITIICHFEDEKFRPCDAWAIPLLSTGLGIKCRYEYGAKDGFSSGIKGIV
jgi:hypothetical protein